MTYPLGSIPTILTPLDVDPPQSTVEQESRGAHRSFDGAGDIFSMYLEMVGEEDRKMAEGWKADAEGILIFVSFYLSALYFHTT